MAKDFTAWYTVTIGDINYGRHLGNERPLLIFQQARIVYLESLGFSEGDIGQGRGLVVVEAGCRYVKEVFLHDRLAVTVCPGEVSGKKFSFIYTAIRESDQAEVFNGFTAHLALDRQIRRVVELPEEFLQRCRF
jgi:acyl-CoA thioester hydrolase